MASRFLEQFCAAARKVGAQVHVTPDPDAAVRCLEENVDGPILVAPCPSLTRAKFPETLRKIGLDIIEHDFRIHGTTAKAGLTGANFGIAATGSVVLESTDEAVRIATTLPEKHFVVLDPCKIVADSAAAVPLIEALHERLPQAYLACITGPSRTADIERVLTIGVHGPIELHVLLLEGVSDAPMER